MPRESGAICWRCEKNLQKVYEAREDRAIVLLCFRTIPIETGLPPPEDILLFYHSIQFKRIFITIMGKDESRFRGSQQW